MHLALRRRTVYSSALLLLGALVAPACSSSGESATSSGSATNVVTTTSIAASTTSSSTTTSTSSTTTTTTTTLLPWQYFPTGTPVHVGNNGGSAAWISKVDTTDPVIFLTIDDGYLRDPRVPQLLAERHIPATLFVVPSAVSKDPWYFAQFFWNGGTINSHTVHHPKLKGMSYDEQVAEICGGRSALAKRLGGAGNLFRPPYGELDKTSLAAAGSCGIEAAVTWRVVLSDGNLNTIGNKPLQPGDIVLAHFRPTLYDDLLLLIGAVEAAGLTFARLEDYVGAPIP